MEVRHQRVDPAELEAGSDEEIGAALERRASRKRLEDPGRRRADGEHARRRGDPRPRGRRVALAVEHVLVELVDGERPEGVEPDVERDALELEPRQQLGREVEAGGRRRRRAGLLGVDGLVALGVGERLGDVGRQRRLARRLAGEPEPPAALAEVLEQLDRTVGPPRAEAPRRPREALPEIVAEPLDEQHLAAWRLDPDPRGHDAGVVDDDERVARLLGKLGERAMPDRAGRTLVDEQARGVAPLRRVLGDQLRRQVVVELRGFHPTSTLSLLSVDEDAIERARERLQAAAEGRADAGAVEAALERARDQVESLAQAAAELAATLPAQVGDAVREGLRVEAIPVSRHLAEVRGLPNQTIRRLERLEADMLAERHSRVDDLALLVDLIASGWTRVDERLARIEHGLESRSGAVVYRMEERRAGGDPPAEELISSRAEASAQSATQIRIGRSESRTCSGSSPASSRCISSR